MIRGEIWWVDLGLPFKSEPGFERPILIVQNDSFNKSKINTIISVPLTTNLNLQSAPGNVFLTRKETNLSKDSVVNVSQIITLDRERFIRKVSNLKSNSIKKIDEGLRLVLDLWI
ncbi:MAG: type II toxin-antitoxin system PemK/MazF family toxin [Leptospiraceae bacterium]|nr:type II toxin-antitoxin system PemK/MazF family toxin [Leptospiraceae bacterium]